MDPLIGVLIGYVAGVLISFAAGCDAIVRMGRAGVTVTSWREALRWIFGTPNEYAPKNEPGLVTRLIQRLKGSKEIEP